MSGGNLLLGRGNSGAGVPEEITLSNSFIMTGAALSVRSGIVNYAYNSAVTEPPAAGQVRLNVVYPFAAVSRVWLRFESADGQDLYWAVMLIPTGATLLVQDKDDHARYVRLTTTGEPVDKGLYCEIPVVRQAVGAQINTASQVLVRVAGTIESGTVLPQVLERLDALESRLRALER